MEYHYFIPLFLLAVIHSTARISAPDKSGSDR